MIRDLKYCFVLGILFLVPVFLPAQTAAELERVLNSPAVTCSQAARFVGARKGD